MTDTDTWWKRWIVGIILPLWFTFDSIRELIQKTADIGSHSHYIVRGPAALAVGFADLFIALALHAYFFWEGRERLAGYREIVACIGIIGALIAGGYFVYLDFRP